MNQSDTPLISALQACAAQNDAPFYTPGHKRGRGIASCLQELLLGNPFAADLPELPELDNLFAPTGVIQAAQTLAADVFGADQTWFLTNGSTSGVIAGIVAVCNPGDKIILPRNIHQSAIAGLVTSGAIPVFVNPEYDADFNLAHSVAPTTISEALAKHPNAKAVLLVSPTYYGTCGDVATIAQLCHQHGIPLLVDEAHGPHFGFHPDLPHSALQSGADLVVQSTHKVLSALTQAAMMHVQGNLIDRDRLTKAISLVQSTSPNYWLLASLDAARFQMASQGKALMEHTLRLANLARAQLAQIPGIALLSPNQANHPGFAALDLTRLTVKVSGLGLDGFTADEILHASGVTAELPSLQHLSFIVSLGNTDVDIERLVHGFTLLAAQAEANFDPGFVTNLEVLPSPVVKLSPRDAFFAPTETIPIEAACDRLCGELLCPYPPGIPALIPGEVITQEAIDYLHTILAAGGVVSGCSDPQLQVVKVINLSAQR